MKILIISQYYPPEIGACANRISSYAKLLARDHTVAVLTSVPNYPDGILYQNYPNEFLIEEKNSVRILRVPVMLSRKKSVAGRLGQYFSFVFNGLKHSAAIAKPDLIWATSPPLFAPLVGLRLAKKFRVPFVLDVRDIWPASAQAVGAISNYFLMRAGRNLANRLYRAAGAITVTSDGIANGIPAEFQGKVVTISNGFDEDLFAHHTGENPLPPEMHKKKVVMYCGNLGLAQSPEVMIHAANLLQNHDDLQFVIIGSGVLAPKIRAMIDALKLPNVFFAGTVAHAEIPKYIHAATVCLIPYKASETFRNTIPSKLFEYMAGGKPVIINLEGEAADLIRKAACGVVAAEEDPESLAEAIDAITKNLKHAEEMGRTGRDFVQKHFQKSSIVKKLELLFRESTMESPWNST